MNLENLSPEQREVVETWGRGQAVIAGAGCGKTTTMVTKLLELTRRNPEARFVAVSFTEKSAADLRARLAAGLRERGQSLSSHWVTTIHGLCGKILREYPHLINLDGEESVLAEDEASRLWTASLDRLFFFDVPDAVGEALDLLMERESKASLLDLLSRLKSLHGFGAAERLKSSLRPDERALVCLFEYVFDFYSRQKFREGALDFDDLETKASQVLRSEAAQKAFHDRFDLILVDEFQDTNPVQAEIIFNLARPQAANLCVVGDPKQSIYRFRDADVSVFDECCSRLPVRQELTWNFRSTPGIIEYVNQVCQPLFEEQSQVYDALEAKRDKGPDTPVLTLNAASPEQLAQWLLDQDAPLGEYSLLLRRVRGSEKWLRALASVGIPVAVGSGGRFWADPRVREFACLLKWFWAPENQLSGATFLRAPWMQVSDGQLHAWVTSGQSLWQSFVESGHAVAQTLVELREGTAGPTDVLEALMERPEVEADSAQNLLGLWQRVSEWMGSGSDFSEIVTQLDDALNNEPRQREVPPPRTSDVLTVMTLHGSKGLEFPRVILIDFPQNEPRAKGAPLLFWDRKRGAYLGKRDSTGNRDRKDLEEKEWRAIESRQQIAESARLFYVALTRAKNQLVLVEPESDKEAKPTKEPYLRDHWRAWIHESPGARSERVDLASASRPAAAVKEKAPPAPVVRRPRPIEYRRSRWSASEWNYFKRSESEFYSRYVLGEEVEYASDPSGPGGLSIPANELGTKIHEALEIEEPIERREALREIEALVGPRFFVAEPVADWADSSPWFEGEGYPELPFEFPVGEEVFVGAMDRLVETPEGDFAVIDFKFTVADRSPDDLLRTYRHQLELYAAAASFVEPRAWGRTRAVLVHISRSGVTEIEVPLSEWVSSSDAARNELATGLRRMNELLNHSFGDQKSTRSKRP